MRTHIANAFYGVIDYVAWPVGMLAVAPVAVRALGVDRYGIWMVANSAISVGAIVASGFSDAGLRYVAMQRAAGNHDRLCRAVRSTMGIHLALGSILAIAAWLLSPVMTHRLTGHSLGSGSGLQNDCVWSLRIAALLILVRALESVCISTQRAFEHYGDAVRTSVTGRLLSLASAAVLPLIWPSVSAVLIAAAVISTLSTGLQMARLARLLGLSFLSASFDRDTMRTLVGFGRFTWIQAVSMLLLGQVDRLVTGAALGAAAVSSYAMCVQLAQPIYGITAAGLHFLFPRISAQVALNDFVNMRRTVLAAIAINWLAVALGTSLLLFFGGGILHAWGGDPIARAGLPVLPIVLSSTALSALSVAGSYAMLALGRVQIVTWLNLAAAAAMISSIVWLLPLYGIRGMAMARLVYGPITLGVYGPLLLHLFRKPAPPRPTTEPQQALCEEV